MRIPRGGAIAAVLAVATVATFAVGVSAVTAAGKAKPVKACVNSKHDLSLLSGGKCKSGSHKVSIGVQGPRGKSGLSAGYTADAFGTSSGYLTTTDFTGIVERTLPAGRYIVNWNVEMSNDSATEGAFECWVAYGATIGPLIANDIPGDSTVIGRAALSQSVAIGLAKTSTISLECESLSGTLIRPGSNEIQDLNAVAVNTLP
jgi:hypothetical protein